MLLTDNWRLEKKSYWVELDLSADAGEACFLYRSWLVIREIHLWTVTFGCFSFFCPLLSFKDFLHSVCKVVLWTSWHDGMKELNFRFTNLLMGKLKRSLCFSTLRHETVELTFNLMIDLVLLSECREEKKEWDMGVQRGAVHGFLF